MSSESEEIILEASEIEITKFCMKHIPYYNLIERELTGYTQLKEKEYTKFLDKVHPQLKEIKRIRRVMAFLNKWEYS